ncbi:MAG: response regulator transcription factor [Lachnospiraceae bacterium]|nr:response regulator transcription factor [Lachnospiraceae bacterium]MBQ1514363.1 response regulator transcription factor [Lachnospiraceae bacterium]
MIQILIVEDDPNIAKTIEVTLSLVGYGCEICDNGTDAAALLGSGRFDLCLLDVMLPGMDGFEVAERTAGCGTPVIFLTARGDIMDKVKGLRMGAEDYIVKPFEAMELLARIEVVLRRFEKGDTEFVYRDIRVDTKKHLVMKAGEKIDLTPKEFDVLLMFLQNVDVAISRERLLASVWGYEYYGETRTVDIHIQQIRKKLDLKKDLVTIPKLGYRLERPAAQ